MKADPIMPSLGRIVLFRGSDNVTRPAIVTAVHGIFCINIHVFGRASDDKEAGVKTSVTHADPIEEPGCFPSWHWMTYQVQAQAQSIKAGAK